MTTKNKAAQSLRAIPSAKRADASRSNGAKGGRPRTKFELVFCGGAMNQENRTVRYRRNHATLASAKEAAFKARDNGVCTPHSAIIYGPGCGKDGIAV
jgi:hypothetical protein